MGGAAIYLFLYYLSILGRISIDHEELCYFFNTLPLLWNNWHS